VTVDEHGGSAVQVLNILRGDAREVRATPFGDGSRG
jgi:hypothetical protein